MASVDNISVEVVYALPEQTHLVSLQIRKGAVIRNAIEQSGLLEHFPEIDLTRNRVGIFSKLKDLDTVLQAGDRVEIYRLLKVDPKEARRKRAEKKKTNN